jgi:UDP-4-amino-4,6-dideoxy-N-acetyl-beta-L-altrosamine N-acetyltransferase
VLRPVTDDDLRTMLRWRNHPQVRFASFTVHEIGWEEHAAWWERAKADPTRRTLMHERDGVADGVVSFTGIDVDAGSAEWGFYLDNAGLEARGELLPAWIELEREAVDHAFDELGLVVLRGYTIATNRVVLQLHRRMGFREVCVTEQSIDGTVHSVVLTELRAENRSHRR